MAFDFMAFASANWFYILLLVVGAFAMYKFFFSKSGDKQLQRIALEELILEDLDTLYKYFHVNVGKVLTSGFNNVSYVLGAVSIFNDPNKPLLTNLKANTQLANKVKADNQEVDKENSNSETKDEKKPKKKKEIEIKPIEELYCFKVCDTGIRARLMAHFFNSGTSYFIVPKKLVKITAGAVVMEPNVSKDVYFKLIIFSESGKNLVDNITFKVQTEQLLKEFVNYIPKMNYLETDIASAIAKMRERAEIEKAKYKSQTENAEDS